ncbi:hydrolase TatD [Candidatus Endobugula sertula]|uniref:Hydrolase TatD n=1 Tax=Candidatus Endobugula sertula TaxID=62101 RepID=A0A1D2QSE1_9GAMM|nr:hydrolase TatD [Candidatus Endobugula sertula]
MFVDSHCHLDRLQLEAYDNQLAAAIDAATARGIQQFLCVGISVNNRQAVVDIAEKYPSVVSSVGVHPLDVKEGLATGEELIQWSQHPKVVALGETGLDYYYSEEEKVLQQESFVIHLEAAARVQLPVIVHTRDARDDTLALIKKYGSESSAGVLHCFTENWDMARRAMDMNYFISVSGIVTFKNANALREVVKQIPMDRLLIETDSPYLAPVPYRGKPNEPKYIKEVAEYIAALRGISLVELADITSANFYRLFNKAA